MILFLCHISGRKLVELTQVFFFCFFNYFFYLMCLKIDYHCFIQLFLYILSRFYFLVYQIKSFRFFKNI
jgi:hypothetical protein